VKDTPQDEKSTVELAAVTIDCQDPVPMIAFYQAMADGQITRYFKDGGANITIGTTSVNIRHVEDFKAPTWPSPDVPMQIHFEFYIDDLQQAEARLQRIGATTAGHQPHNQPGMLVMLDPAGHPFCIGTRV